jgi:hypothetical protein
MSETNTQNTNNSDDFSALTFRILETLIEGNRDRKRTIACDCLAIRRFLQVNKTVTGYVYGNTLFGSAEPEDTTDILVGVMPIDAMKKSEIAEWLRRRMPELTEDEANDRASELKADIASCPVCSGTGTLSTDPSAIRHTAARIGVLRDAGNARDFNDALRRLRGMDRGRYAQVTWAKR